MSDRRRIVPDTSVIVEALLTSGGGVRQARANQLLSAVLNNSVITFAPDTLLVEFTKVAFNYHHGARREVSMAVEEIDAQLDSFLTMPFVYVPSEDLAISAIHHTRAHHLSPTDFWFLAAAEQHAAELWISHEHTDGFTEIARRVYEKVYTLADDDFYSIHRKGGA